MLQGGERPSGVFSPETLEAKMQSKNFRIHARAGMVFPSLKLNVLLAGSITCRIGLGGCIGA